MFSEQAPVRVSQCEKSSDRSSAFACSQLSGLSVWRILSVQSRIQLNLQATTLQKHQRDAALPQNAPPILRVARCVGGFPYDLDDG